jgi:putative ABC transport system permease protein
MIWATLLIALREIRRNKLRSFLTVLGIVIGVSAVITMVTLGNGATLAISNQISSLGSNLLILQPGQRLGPGGSQGAAQFKIADAEAIRSEIGGLKAVAPVVNANATIVRGPKNWTTSVTGTTDEYFQTANWKFAAGRPFEESEERAGQSVCVIGETIHRELFEGENPIGSSIRVKQFTCQVIGLLQAKGQSSFGSDQDDLVVMPIRTVQRRLTGSQDIRQIRISVQDGVSIDHAQEMITQLMRDRRRIPENEENNFNVLDTRQIAETLSGTTRVMTTLLGAVAAVSLLVGGIGIMNIMLVSVTERTREIGIRLAIGALEREVLLQFLVEAVTLASLGGITGIILATIFSIVLANSMNVPFIFIPTMNLLSFLFSAAIGVVFGFFPARRAAQLDPIEALRHE